MKTFTYPTVNQLKTGERIKQLRTDKGYSANDLADFLHLQSAQAIYNWQWGNTLPSVDNLMCLSKLFNVSIEEILVVDYYEDSFFYLFSFTYPSISPIFDSSFAITNIGFTFVPFVP